MSLLTRSEFLEVISYYLTNYSIEKVLANKYKLIEANGFSTVLDSVLDLGHVYEVGDSEDVINKVELLILTDNMHRKYTPVHDLTIEDCVEACGMCNAMAKIDKDNAKFWQMLRGMYLVVVRKRGLTDEE